jgi:two-component system sensor histidine kinase CpxA
LRSAIENVVRNAVRYTAEGTAVELSLRCSGSEMEKAQAVISVQDHGPGVPEETLGKLFRPFYRVADARDRQSGGAGLGLAITARAVRFHGGDVTASNAQGGGLLVEISLPAAAQTNR